MIQDTLTKWKSKVIVKNEIEKYLVNGKDFIDEEDKSIVHWKPVEIVVEFRVQGAHFG